MEINSKFNLENERIFVMSDFEKYMENRNVIDRVQHTNVTKKEFLALIGYAEGFNTLKMLVEDEEDKYIIA